MKGQWIQQSENDTTVIFVHGILSSSEKCWTHENNTYWPQLLNEEPDLDGIGIYTFSYATGIFSKEYQLGDIVDALKEHLRLDNVLENNKQLIFVCHSMGGIVVRKFIVDRQLDLIDKAIKLALFLVASPSLGSQYANWIVYLATAFKIRHAQAESLRFARDNTWLNDLDKNFQNLKEGSLFDIKGKELIEDRSLILKNWIGKPIVESFSGAKYFGEPVKIPDSDHSTIAKPSDRNAFQHRLLCKFINEQKSGAVTTTTQSHTLGSTAPDTVGRHFNNRLNDALSSFSSQPTIWVDPVLAKAPEHNSDMETEDRIPMSDLLKEPKSTIIKAPPQFGLTCLAYYLIQQAWAASKSSLWLYLDAKTLKPHVSEIERAVKRELNPLGLDTKDVACVILDSWSNTEQDSIKLLEKVCNHFKDVPVIVMQSLDGTSFVSQTPDLHGREFNILYLWSLSRGDIRKMVARYNEVRNVGSEDAVIKKVISDMDVLNLHRTPLNCLTLLKVSEVDFDESPVNRAEMIKRVLFLLFNVDDIPTYKARPDLKDCEYVLGYFCETLLREMRKSFTREYFLETLLRYCKARFIDLEVHVVFDVLYANNIIIAHNNSFRFKFTYWIYYFAAQRMFHDQAFADFVLDHMNYARFPEIIEFYTGVDRNREAALRRLTKDIRDTTDKVQEKIGIPDGMNPYRFATWRPSTAMLEQMQKEICDGVQDSNLPETIKDSYLDRQYDKSRPYNQEVRDIIQAYSVAFMMQAMKAGARALRNSDYVDPDIKRDLLKEIMRCWEQVSKVLMILLPLLAERGHAAFDGQGFNLRGYFGDNFDERFKTILLEIPNNMVLWTQDDLFSQKMGPLLLDQFKNEPDELKRHILSILLIYQRPRDWREQMERYIESVSPNSFYLLDVYRILREQYRHCYAPRRVLSDIEHLIKLAAAKHTSGRKLPGQKHMKRLTKDVIPKREIDQDGV
ncbi:esterase/lipase family protein [Methylogaea oryzae]|uniref:DUF676 domain-containing protein n=1 Tax=Methylogaea oryzae TaxID=1295382 RepID=A0A8D4VR40_9GAMM|nr:hypothetical protein [Methylogaea oryzae]BBL72575.1 hypothetical protein MoryE10_31810 [Methylogaea oryzae]